MLEAVFLNGIDKITLDGLTQWDIGQKIKIILSSLPSTFQVHFASRGDEIAYVVDVTATDGVATVEIPNVILQQPKDAIAWIYIIDASESETVKTIYLPVAKRAKPADYAYTNEEYLSYAVVKVTAQTFTEEEQAQARANIGAVGVGEAKSAYVTAQEAGYLGTEEEFAKKLATDFIDWFGVGTSIPEAADLNTYKTNGKYYCGTESRSQTLANRPDGMNTNFVMWVFQRTTSNIYSQLMITLHGKMYIRSSATSAWRGWVAYTTSDEIAELIESAKQEIIADAVQPDWEQNDTTAADYIKNRPFYTSYDGNGVLLPEQTVSVTGDDEICAPLSGDFSVELGQMYTVVFDGEPYECYAYESSDTGEIVLGNLDISADAAILGENKGSDEPFAIVRGTTAWWIYTADTGDYIVSVLGGANVVKMDEKYLPESVDGVVVRSSTQGSEKRFKITVNDSGTISATEV